MRAERRANAESNAESNDSSDAPRTYLTNIRACQVHERINTQVL